MPSLDDEPSNHVVRRIELNPGSEPSLDTLREQGKTDLAPASPPIDRHRIAVARDGSGAAKVAAEWNRTTRMTEGLFRCDGNGPTAE